ncbi:porin, partial [Burkholderia cepacia]
GTEDLGGGLKAIFVLENGFNSGNGTIGQGGAIFGRQAYVGLSQSQYGTVTFGRQYSFSTDILGSNYSTGGNTVAGNYAYHVNDIDQLTSSRINNAVKFQS